jgi:hypothetical protein
MSWWKRLRLAPSKPSASDRLHSARIGLPGWTEEQGTPGLRAWRDPDGSVLSLAAPEGPLELPSTSDEPGIRAFARSIAESRWAGLIEACAETGALGEGLRFIYKRLQKPAYIFTGMLLLSRPEGPYVWTVVDRERGTTGVREAIITSELFNTGRLTVEEYERSWARDPYEPEYRGVDRSILRFVSDNESYDARFPDHPLSKVRRTLAALPVSVQFETPLKRRWTLYPC